MTLTKSELAESLAQHVSMQKGDAKELVDYVFEEIRRALESGDEVKISGFGNFELKNKNQRPGRNPKTGEDVAIQARRVVTFKPGQKLKDRVEHYDKNSAENNPENNNESNTDSSENSDKINK